MSGNIDNKNGEALAGLSEMVSGKMLQSIEYNEGPMTYETLLFRFKCGTTLSFEYDWINSISLDAREVKK